MTLTLLESFYLSDCYRASATGAVYRWVLSQHRFVCRTGNKRASEFGHPSLHSYWLPRRLWNMANFLSFKLTERQVPIRQELIAIPHQLSPLSLWRYLQLELLLSQIRPRSFKGSSTDLSLLLKQLWKIAKHMSSSSCEWCTRKESLQSLKELEQNDHRVKERKKLWVSNKIDCSTPFQIKWKKSKQGYTKALAP